jgi:hypothetical protein
MPVKRKPRVAVDLDGVLAQWDGQWSGVESIGEPIPGAVEFTQELSKIADVLIWTTRTNPDENFELSQAAARAVVTRWLDQHGFAYRNVYIGEGKPVAAAYVDDRAVICEPQKPLAMTAYSDAYERVKTLLPT